MKTKYISTTYSDGYTLAPGYRAIDIEASGAIDGGLTLTDADTVKVTIDGTVAGFNNAYGTGGAGLSVTGLARLTGAGIIVGGTGGYYKDNGHVANGGGGRSADVGLETEHNDGDRLIAEAGATFIGTVTGGGGTLELARGSGTITGLGASGTLSGAVAMTFGGFGSYDFDRGGAWALNGANSASGCVTNGGSLTIASEASLQINGAVDNNGVLETVGILTLIGPVSGTGTAVIDAGVLDAGSAFTQDVTFSGTTGGLELADATTYGGAITSFSLTGGTSLDLRDAGFVDAGEATFSGTATGGVLTVTDGTDTARIMLKGNRLGSTFAASSDGHGGTDVVAQSTERPAASVHAFISSMAAFGPAGGQAVHSGEALSFRELMLTSPRVAIA